MSELLQVGGGLPGDRPATGSGAPQLNHSTAERLTLTSSVL